MTPNTGKALTRFEGRDRNTGKRAYVLPAASHPRASELSPRGLIAKGAAVGPRAPPPLAAACTHLCWVCARGDAHVASVGRFCQKFSRGVVPPAAASHSNHTGWPGEEEAGQRGRALPPAPRSPGAAASNSASRTGLRAKSLQVFPWHHHPPSPYPHPPPSPDLHQQTGLLAAPSRTPGVITSQRLEHAAGPCQASVFTSVKWG